jgi:hypothetical protein
MAMELKGKVIQILPMQTGQGKKGTWRKQEFILETQAQYPKKVCLSLWGDKIDQFKISEGEIVNVSVDLESREYNSRWYTEARAWKLEKSAGSGSSSAPMPSSDESYETSSSAATDDLPF